MISCRHLCAVVAVKKATKELKWIFGDPAGWAEAYAPYLLKAADADTTWSYGQHQLTLSENGDRFSYKLGYIRAKADGGFKVVPSRWISLKDLPAGNYAIYVVMNGETWDTGKSVRVS